MIVCMHSPLPSDESNSMFLSSLSYLTAPGIGLFFMVSGALLLPAKTDAKTFLKRRFTKIGIPTIVWTMFYMVCNTPLRDEPMTLRSLLSIPFSPQGNSVLWFIYTLLGLYLLAPIASYWLKTASRREIEFYLGLWGVTLCFPLLEFVVNVNEGTTGVLYYFTGYAGYFVLGYYLQTYPERLSYKWLLPAMAVAILAPALCKVWNVQVDFYSMFWYLSVFVVVQCLFWWKVMCSMTNLLKGHSGTVISIIAQLTFGVYLVHIFVMRYVLWQCDFILAIQPYVLQTFVITALTFAGSLAICWLISLPPFSKYLIGK